MSDFLKEVFGALASYIIGPLVGMAILKATNNPWLSFSVAILVGRGIFIIQKG